MRKIDKKQDSLILQQNLQYIKQNQRPTILAVLEAEQDNFCAYTEERFTAGYARDIEHFNPTLKDTSQDNYENWFAVSHKFNVMKGTRNADSRWHEYQPLLLPTDNDLEKRVLYDDGYYIAHPQDIEAKNLIEYLHLNNDNLSSERKKFIQMLRDLLENSENEQTFEKFLKKNKATLAQFPRAIREEFGIII